MRGTHIRVDSAVVSTKPTSAFYRYIDYIRRLIDLRHLYGVNRVALRNTHLMSEMGITAGVYQHMIRKLRAVGIISKTVDHGCSFTHHANLYNLDEEVLASYGITLYDRPTKDDAESIAIPAAQDRTIIQDSCTDDAPTSSVPAEKWYSGKKLEKLRAKQWERVRIGPNLRITALTDDEIVRAVYDKFPQMVECQRIIHEMNSGTDDRYSKIVMTPHVHRADSGVCTKISLRATTPFCNTTTQGEDSPRSRILDKKFPDGWREVDISGSVPRIAHLMATGEFPADDEDPYRVMFEPLLGCWDDRIRKICKSIFMKLYFGGSAKKVAWLDTYRVMNAMHDLETDRAFLASADVDRETVRDIRRNLLRRRYRVYDTDTVHKFSQAISAYCGENVYCKTDVFMHESIIYIMAANRLRDEGHDVYQCYDAFYVPADVSERHVLDIVRVCADEYFARWGSESDHIVPADDTDETITHSECIQFIHRFLKNTYMVYDTGKRIIRNPSTVSC